MQACIKRSERLEASPLRDCMCCVTAPRSSGELARGFESIAGVVGYLLSLAVGRAIFVDVSPEWSYQRSASVIPSKLWYEKPL